jgi:hypothetical protein
MRRAFPSQDFFSGVYTMSATINARFWIWHNDGWVKLTLRPGQVFTVVDGGPTDEGYSYTAQVYTHEGDHILRETSTRAADCDGPHEYYADCTAALDALQEYLCDDGTRVPSWERVRASQRDRFAEDAGY